MPQIAKARVEHRAVLKLFLYWPRAGWGNAPENESGHSGTGLLGRGEERRGEETERERGREREKSLTGRGGEERERVTGRM